MALSQHDKAVLKSLPIQGYLDWRGIDYVRVSANELRLVDHDSLVIRTNRNQYFWNSRNVKGDLVSFIANYELGDETKPGVMKEALARRFAYAREIKGANIDVNQYKHQKSKESFDWNKIFKAKDTVRAKNYLVQERGLNPKLVEFCINQGLIFEGSQFRVPGDLTKRLNPEPVLFAWKDGSGKIVGADRQGTEIDKALHGKRGTTKQIMAGSDSTHGFNLAFGTGQDTLIAFESPIDLLSYAQQNHVQLAKDNTTLLSVSGTNGRKVYEFLAERLKFDQEAMPKKIQYAFDNDLAGFEAMPELQFEGIVYSRILPINGYKDWNEQLKAGESGQEVMTYDGAITRRNQLADLEEKQTKQKSQTPIINLKDQNQVATNQAKHKGKKETAWVNKAERSKINREKNIKIVKEAMAQVGKFHDDPKELKNLLDFISTGLNYSSRNSLLIKLQRPDATLVKGYRQWAQQGIQINKGEKGLKIFGAPTKLVTIITENGERVMWRDATDAQKQAAKAKQLETLEIQHYPVETVFDVRQTNATQEQLPKLLPNRPIDLQTDQSPQHIDNAYQALTKYVGELGITLHSDAKGDTLLTQRPQTWQGQAKGMFAQMSDSKDKRIYLRTDLPMTDKVHVLAHEIAHAKLHGLMSKADYPKEIKELQAEMTSYVVTKNLGIDPGPDSIRYMSSWTDNLKKMPSVADTGKILSQVVDAATDVQRYLSHNLENGAVKKQTSALAQGVKQAKVQEVAAKATLTR